MQIQEIQVILKSNYGISHLENKNAFIGKIKKKNKYNYIYCLIKAGNITYCHSLTIIKSI